MRFYIRGGITAARLKGGTTPPTAAVTNEWRSANVHQSGCLGALVNGAGTCPSTNTGGTPLDTVCPAVGLSTMSSGQAFELQSTRGDGGIEFGSGHRVGHRVRLSGLRLPDYPTTSEGDGGRGRGIDFGKVLGALLNALSFQVGGDGVQDRQQLGTVSGTVQESGSEVAGHRSVGCVFFGIVADGGDQRSQSMSFIS